MLSVSRTDPDRQEVAGQYVDITEAGIKLRPWHIRWATPDQLDGMAATAGLERATRWSGWDQADHVPDDTRHVTVYRRAQA